MSKRIEKLKLITEEIAWTEG